MRIALIIDGLAGGGAEKAFLKIATALRKAGADAQIIAMENRVHHQIPDTVPVHMIYPRPNSLSRSWFGKRLAAMQLRRMFRRLEQEGRFDLSISTLTPSDEICQLAGIPRLWHRIANTLSMHIDHLDKRNPAKAERRRRRYRRMYDGANLIAVSQGVADDLINALGIRPKRLEVIPNPFDLESIRSRSLEPTAIPDEPYIIHVGRAHPQKRHDLLFDAFLKLDFGGKLVLLTHRSEWLLKLIEEKGLQERVILPGFQTNPYPWVRGARLLTLSSDWEGLPNVLIEALAVGTPVVSTSCPSGPSEIMTGPLAAFLAPCGDADALCAAMQRALQAYPAIDSALLARYTPEQIAQRYAGLSDSPQ